MGTERDAGSQAELPYDRKQLSSRQRALLYFNTTRRKFWAGAALVAVWLLLEVLLNGQPYLERIPALVLYTGIAVLWILFSHGAGLYKPFPLPAPVMHKDAKARFSTEETWESTMPAPAAVAALRELFNQAGAEVQSMDGSLWVRLSKDWKAVDWWHKAAASHIKRPPSVQFFVEAADGGCQVSAYSGDRMLAGMYDVLKLSDEMSATAVEVARKATKATAPPM